RCLHGRDLYHAVESRAMRLLGTVTLGIALFMVVGAAGQSWTPPRTPWGDPDLQETWSTEDLRDIPYERPAQYAGRPLLTDEEFAARQAQAQRERAATGFANTSK